jgi:hypothetical protein
VSDDDNTLRMERAPKRRNYTLIAVEPAGARSNAAFLHGAVRPTSEPVYPTSVEGMRLRALRVGAVKHLGLRECAKLLGLTGAELTALETGAATLAEGEWARLFHELADATEPGGGLSGEG